MIEQFISDNMFQIIGFVSMLVGLYVTSDKTQAVVKVELNHVKEDVNHVKEEVARLELKQEESNRVKERVALLEHDQQTLWKRLDELKEQ